MINIIVLSICISLISLIITRCYDKFYNKQYNRNVYINIFFQSFISSVIVLYIDNNLNKNILITSNSNTHQHTSQFNKTSGFSEGLNNISLDSLPKFKFDTGMPNF
jgi:uncharacterized membrane protein